ncbi:glycosyltransferase [Alicyclobacillus fastidiosus]|uniref:Glycosyltransferase n=1 Tax=Alicyclobacillus fastidiosus TaxID=392011 RepID=A0ABV5AG70_9BACL|nr:glycosyltransferase [Alicyclobacillus fastidiosus]WEH08897.1 glycosyltransferase [Alicyclobacillus fastidiosus]
MQPCVLLVLDQLNIGGTETHVLSIARECKRRGVKVLVAAKSGALLPQLQQFDIPFYEIPFSLYDTIDPALQHQLVEQLANVAVREGVTVLHAHQTPSGSIAASVSQRLSIPLFFTVHGTYYGRGALARILDQSWTGISVSLPVQALITELGYASILIPNGVDVDEFRPGDGRDIRQELSIPDSAFVVLSASRISWQKAAVSRLLLQVCTDLKARRVSNLHVMVVGDGNRYHELEVFSRKLNARRRAEFVHLLGKRQDMSRCYAAANVVVGTGRVALEAMACAKPVIAIGEHGYFGLVQPENFASAWSMYFGDHASRSLSTRSRLFRELSEVVQSGQLETIGAASRKWVAESFSIEQTCTTLIDEYRKSLLHR